MDTGYVNFKKGGNQYGKAKPIQVETLSARTNLINSKMVPAVQFELS
ncbi:hypothetical protein [Bacillus pseudomycoides]|nr:hypothetical protein [Bacillus pseudomycoides]